jgi:hypothetical protein
MNTPWGKSDSKQTVRRGLSFVTTPSHGGFMVAKGYAYKHFSPEAIVRGKAYGGYLAYEEDCDASIVLWEAYDTFLSLPVTEWTINVPTKESLIKSLSHWHADFLIARGVEPDADGLRYFNENKQRDRMQADRSPDLIVSASGDWKTGVPKGWVEVTTAAGTRHLVKDSEYSEKRNGLTLLSTFTAVVEVRS